MMQHFESITRLLPFANSGLFITSALKSCLVMQDVIVCLAC